VVGATATGKSQWALNMAEKHRGVIFNCDSVQIYKHLNVGSAKPSSGDFARVPHHLFDLISAPDSITAGDYRRLFEEEIKKIPMAQPIFLVGGTGFYFQAIEKGLYPVLKASPELRKQIEDEMAQPEGAWTLYQELRTKDPEAAKKISRNDHYRLARALEIIRSEGQTLTEIKKKFAAEPNAREFSCLKVGLTCEKEVLWKRIESRATQMVRGGLREEVQKLLDQGLGGWGPLSSVGYLQTQEALREEKSDPWLVEAISIGTRQLAKRQKTWFKRDPEIFWVSDASTCEASEKNLEEFLKS